MATFSPGARQAVRRYYYTIGLHIVSIKSKPKQSALLSCVYGDLDAYIDSKFRLTSKRATALEIPFLRSIISSTNQRVKIISAINLQLVVKLLIGKLVSPYDARSKRPIVCGCDN